jgi:hypothetical protein
MTTRLVEKADGRRGVLMVLGLSLLANFLIWLIVLSAPEAVIVFYVSLGGVSSKLSNILFFVPVASGFMSAYSLFRWKFPDIEENRNLASGLMASFEYQNHSAKRYLIWLLSMIAGVSNAIVCLFWLRHSPFPETLSFLSR